MSAATRKIAPQVVGWREWVELPELGVTTKVKVDTGARTSALHADDLEFFERGGRPWVRFVVHPEQRTNRVEVHCEAPVLEDRQVKSSTGSITHRPVIETRISLGGQSWPIELTLINRDEMGFRMLLGRTAIKRRFVVDVGHSYVQSHDLDVAHRRAAKKVKKKKKKASKKPGRKSVQS